MLLHKELIRIISSLPMHRRNNHIACVYVDILVHLARESVVGGCDGYEYFFFDHCVVLVHNPKKQTPLPILFIHPKMSMATAQMWPVLPQSLSFTLSLLERVERSAQVKYCHASLVYDVWV